MLVLSRKLGQSFHVGPQVRVTIVKIDHNSTWIGIEAPDDVSVQREGDRILSCRKIARLELGGCLKERKDGVRLTPVRPNRTWGHRFRRCARQLKVGTRPPHGCASGSALRSRLVVPVPLTSVLAVASTSSPARTEMVHRPGQRLLSSNRSNSERLKNGNRNDACEGPVATIRSGTGHGPRKEMEPRTVPPGASRCSPASATSDATLTLSTRHHPRLES